MNRRGNKRIQRLERSLAGLLALLALLCLPAGAAESVAPGDAENTGEESPVPLSELSGSCGQDLLWTLSGGVLNISGSGEMEDFPDNVFAPWYGAAAEIRTVSLPGRLTSIGDLAFYGCENLAGINIPDGVTSIGSYAFAGCSRLRTVNLPGGLTSIGESAFRECASLVGVRFPDSLERIGSLAFYRCSALTAVRVPASVTYLGSSVFAYCENLVRAEVLAQMETLPEWTFYGCGHLCDVILSSTTTASGEYAFQGCSGLSTVFTQTDDQDTAQKLQDDISSYNRDFAGQGYVAPYDAPNSSVVTVDNGDSQSIIETSQSEHSAVTVTKTTESGDKSTVTTVTSVVEDSDGWGELTRQVIETLKTPGVDQVKVDVQLTDSTIRGEDLRPLAGENAVVRVANRDGTVWEVNTSSRNNSFSGEFDTAVYVEKLEGRRANIPSDNVYEVRFAGSVALRSTVEMELPGAKTYQTATLYQKLEGKPQIVESVAVDRNGRAAFHLASVDKGTRYYIGLDAEDIPQEQVYVPEGLYDTYGVDDPTLMDANGVSYIITGRNSSWGVSLRTVMIGLGVAMLFVVLVVGLVMTLMNKNRQVKAHYARLAAEEDTQPTEEELREAILRELLAEQEGQIQNGEEDGKPV